MTQVAQLMLAADAVFGLSVPAHCYELIIGLVPRTVREHLRAAFLGRNPIVKAIGRFTRRG